MRRAPAKFFVVLREIANVIYRTTSYKKKALLCGFAQGIALAATLNEKSA